MTPQQNPKTGQYQILETFLMKLNSQNHQSNPLINRQKNCEKQNWLRYLLSEIELNGDKSESKKKTVENIYFKN